MTLSKALIFGFAACAVAVFACKRVRNPDESVLRADDGPETPAPEGDQPADAGQSLFDSLIADLGGQVPYPFEELTRQIKAKLAAPGTTASGVLIPVGRSLFRTHANYQFPRLVFAITPDNRRRPAPTDNVTINIGGAQKPADGRLFLGYIDPGGRDDVPGQIEVISWNETAARYEYQIVRDYTETGAKRVEAVADRDTCLTCHQNQGPIFPNRFWDETNKYSDTDRTWRKLCETQSTVDTCNRGPVPQYHGVPLLVQTPVVNGFHTAVETGARIITMQRLWNVAWPGATCRKEVLLRALAVAKRVTTANLPAISDGCRNPAPADFVNRFELLSPFNPFDTRLGLGPTPVAPANFEGNAIMRQYSPQAERPGRTIVATEVAEWLAKLVVGEAGLAAIDPAALGPKLDGTAGQAAMAPGIIHATEFLTRLAAVQAAEDAGTGTGTATSTGTGTGTGTGTVDPPQCANLGNADVEAGYAAFPERRAMFHYCSQCHGKDADQRDFINPDRSDADFRALFGADLRQGALDRLNNNRMPPRLSASGTCLARHPEIKRQIIDFITSLGAPASSDSP